MVGYSADLVLNFSATVDHMRDLRDIRSTFIMGSFYKTMLSDKEVLMENSREIVSVLLALCLARRANSPKYEGKEFNEIAEKAIIPSLNRGLYDQNRTSLEIRSKISSDGIGRVAAEAISEDKYEKVICLIMILVGEDLDDILMSGNDTIRLLEEGNLLGGSYISEKEIIDAAQNMWA